MKVVDMLKHKRESLTKYPFELKDWMSPTIMDYWTEFLTKANNSHIVTWVKEHQHLVNSKESSTPQQHESKLTPESHAVMQELLPLIGEEFHVGEWATIDQEKINQFAQVTDDHQWIHTDQVRAEADSPFKTTISHGFLTLSMLSSLTDSVDPDNSQFPTAKMAVNYGLNKVRFPYPVKSGKRIRARSRLLNVTPIKGGLELEKEISVEIEKCRRPGCVAVSVVRIYF
jgi:acyl dehydratase